MSEMSITDIFSYIKENDVKPLPYTDTDDIARVLGISNYMSSNKTEEFENRFCTYPILTWLCTDTMVGMYLITFDGEILGTTYQSARKNSIEYRLVQDVANIVAGEMIEIAGESFEYSILYTGEKLPTIVYYRPDGKNVGVTYNGEPVDVVEIFSYYSGYKTATDGRQIKISEWGTADRISHVRVRFPDGEERIMPCSDLRQPLDIFVR